jgi:predicted dehydrogenase/flavin reductase (DIM6/NTAB) family NADH-FMN oxidoreductase RutF
VSLSPPLVIVNPNRMHSVEPAVASAGRFAINVMPVSARKTFIRLMNMRRREPEKHHLLGLNILEDERKIPFIAEARFVLFCEVDRSIPSGDRLLYVARVVDKRLNPKLVDQRPLLFSDVRGAGSRPLVLRSARTALLLTGALDLAKKLRETIRPSPPANIALTTYQEAGATEEEMAQILEYGSVDRSRKIQPAPAPAFIRARLSICVVGTGWGGIHCRYLKAANSDIRLFVCGRNRDKTARFAQSVGAEGYFTDLRSAIEDPRVQALTLALPHDMHREAAQAVAAGGKHVLVEKPIATNLADADAMISSAKRAGTILMVAEDVHFRPAIREAAACISRGDVGEPLYLLVHGGGVRRPQGWAADKTRMGGGVLIDIGVHYVRGLRLLMGEPDRVLATRAMQINTKMAGEDSVQLIFSGRYGWQAHMLLSWASQRGNTPDIVLTGDKGTLHLWPGKTYLDFYPVAPRWLPRLIANVYPYWLQEKLYRPSMQRKRIKLDDPDGTGYLGEMQEFLAAVAENREPVTKPEDARRDLEIIHAGYRSLDRETWIDIREATSAQGED